MFERNAGICDNKIYCDKFYCSCRHNNDFSVESIFLNITWCIICIIHNDAERFDTCLRLNQCQSRGCKVDKSRSSCCIVHFEQQSFCDSINLSLKLKKHSSNIDSIKSCLSHLQGLLTKDNESAIRESSNRVNSSIV